MSVDAWLVLAAAVLGVLGGIALARGRGAERGRGDDDLRAQLAVQAAELRRIADQGSQRDLSAEQLRQGMEGARRALDGPHVHAAGALSRATRVRKSPEYRRYKSALRGAAPPLWRVAENPARPDTPSVL